MPTSHYVWTGPFGEVSVRLSLGVIRRLSFDATEAFKSVPRRGLEIGGLLLGRTEDLDGTSTITILDFAPVETEHREGPYFRLSPADLRNFDAALAEHRSDAIGLYRTHTRSQVLSFEDDDNDLLRRCFKQRPGMFLIVHPRGSVAAYGFPQIGPLAPVHEFPFRIASLASVSVTEPEPAPAAHNALPAPGYIPVPRPVNSPSPLPSLAAAAVASPASGPFSSPGAISNPGLASTRGSARSSTRSVSSVPGFLKLPPLPAVWLRPVAALRLPAEWRQWFTPRTWAAISALAASVVVIQAVRRPAPRVPLTQVLAPIALSVERDGPQLRLHWRPDAPAVRAATHAVLYINDGKHQTKLDLAPKQLTSGLVPYRAESGEVLFRLDLFTPSGKTGDSIRVLGAAAPQPVTAASLAAAPPPSAPVVRTAAARRPVLPHPKPAEFEGNAMRAELAVQPSASAALAPIPEPVAFDPAPAVKPAEEVRLPDILSAPPARPLAAAVTVTAEPVTTSSGLSRVVGRLPFVKKLRKQPQPFVPPTAIHEVSPNLSARDRHEISRPVSVDVKVYVTGSGKVDYAELLSDGLGPDRNLATAAVFAARQWQFSPARLGTDSEPAEVVLHFRFAPGSGQ